MQQDGKLTQAVKKASSDLDEFTGKEKNPYRAKMFRSFILFGLSMAVFILLAMLLGRVEGSKAIVHYAGIAVGIFGTMALNDTVSYFRAAAGGYDKPETIVYTELKPEDPKQPPKPRRKAKTPPPRRELRMAPTPLSR